MIYLDNCATTKPDAEVIEAINKCLNEDYGNPSSRHKLGIRSKQIISDARKSVSNLIGAKPENIIFTSVATESNNMAIFNYTESLKCRGNRVICSGFEHASVRRVYDKLSEDGFDVVYIDTDGFGNLDFEQLSEAINENTILLSLILVNNNTGAITDISRAVQLARGKSKWVKVHIDAVQALGKIPIDVRESGCDSMSFSAHKLYGPKGVGALYVKNPFQFKPYLLGGGQEGNLRSGTENVPGIAGFGVACELAKKRLIYDFAYVEKLRLKCIEMINERIEDFIINTSLDFSSPYVLNISFKNVLGEVLLNYLSDKDIYISTGSACSSNGQKHDESIKRMRLEKSYADGTIRISFSRNNTSEEIELFVDELVKAVDFIRGIVRK